MIEAAGLATRKEIRWYFYYSVKFLPPDNLKVVGHLASEK